MVEVISWIIGILVLLTSLPAGYFLSNLCCDELKKDRKYFIAILGLIAVSFVIFLSFYRELSILLSLVYMAIVFGLLILRVKNKK